MREEVRSSTGHGARVGRLAATKWQEMNSTSCSLKYLGWHHERFFFFCFPQQGTFCAQSPAAKLFMLAVCNSRRAYVCVA